MGYPMTWRRLVNRNDLRSGFALGVNVNVSQDDDMAPHVSAVRRERLTRYAEQLRRLCHDVYRLESDALDEHVLCQAITARIPGAHPDLVAAVLKEFFAL